MAERKEYTIADLGITAAAPEEIISGSMDEEIRKRMLTVIEAEAPILESLLYKRVIASFSLRKVGSRILPVFEAAASALPVTITDDNGERVFHRDGEEDCYRPTPDAAVRYSYQIPSSEAACCIRCILERENRTLTKSELQRLFREEMGYDRMGAQVEALFRRAAGYPGIRRTGNGRFTL